MTLLISNSANAFSGSKSVLVNSNLNAVTIGKSKFSSTSKPMINDNPTNKMNLLAKMKISQIEHYLGRKLKFKEKLAFKVLKIKAKNGFKSDDEVKSQKGKTSLTLGIIAIVSLIIFPLVTIPLGILAITTGRAAQKINPNDSDAKTGITLGIVSLAILVLAIIALVALISMFVVH